MTQLSLFDAPSAITNPALLAVRETADCATNQTVVANPDSNGVVEDSTNLVDQLHSDSGLHHMGDLARLVLLRYDLMAKRRAEFAARRRAR
jgi:hypothetical protein